MSLDTSIPEQNEEDEKVLIITSSGGGGHKMAAAAKRKAILRQIEDEIAKIESTINTSLKENPELKDEIKKLYELSRKQIAILEEKKKNIPERDVMMEWTLTGKIGIKLNDELAKKGEIKKIERMVKFQPLANAIYGPSIFLNAIRTLKNTNANLIIDTQAMGTKAICLAARFTNWRNRKKIRQGKKKAIRIRKVITDLPTDKATHFFGGLKGLSKKDKALITLETTEPLLELPAGKKEQDLSAEGKKAYQDAFWENHIGRGFAGITYKDFPLRDAFNDKELTSIANINRQGITVIASNKEESEFLLSLPRQETKATEGYPKEVKFKINESDKVMALMLGSTGGTALKQYVESAIAMANKNKDIMGNNQYYFYVFCGRHEEQKDTLWTQVKDMIAELPKNFHIIPLGAQGDKQIAPIFARADVIISRSGGLSSMEILKTQEQNAQRKVLIHSATDGTSPTPEEKESFLFAGIALWEGGNARYMQEKIGVKITNVDYFKNDLDEIKFFQPKTKLEQGKPSVTIEQAKPKRKLERIQPGVRPDQGTKIEPLVYNSQKQESSGKEKFKEKLRYFKELEKKGEKPEVVFPKKSSPKKSS